MPAGPSLAVALGPAAGWVRADVPVTPDADEARRWAEEELSRGIYAERTNPIGEAISWLLDRLNDLLNAGSAGPDWVLPLAVVAATAIAVTVALVVGGPVRRRRSAAGADALFDDDERTAAEYLAAADDAAARGAFAAAVLDRFRGIIRSLTERALLEDRPGLTADEAAEAAARRLPDASADLAAAAGLFDAVRYGRRPVGASEDAWLREVARTVAEARPEPVTVPPVAAP